MKITKKDVGYSLITLITLTCSSLVIFALYSKPILSFITVLTCFLIYKLICFAFDLINEDKQSDINKSVIINKPPYPYTNYTNYKHIEEEKE